MNAIIAIAASAGGLAPLKAILSALPDPCTAAVFIVVHVGERPSMLPDVLGRATTLPVSHATHGQPIEPGHVYVAPPGYHMRIEPGVITLDHAAKVHFTRPAADPLFVSAAETYGSRVIGVLLSGYDGDGADGLRSIKMRGGTAYVQSPEEAVQPSMPWSAILADHPTILSVAEIANRIAERCSQP